MRAALDRLKKKIDVTIHTLPLLVSNNSIKGQGSLRKNYDYLDSPFRVFDLLAFHRHLEENHDSILQAYCARV